MAAQRPTFSESWYRVADLRPRLRPHAQVFRQHYRGRRWYLVQNASRNQFFRLSEPAYHFLGMLDARRTVATVWRTCLDRLGDDAPTQGEVIKLLGKLYAANMLRVDLPGDTEALFRRYRKGIGRDVRSALMSPLSVRIPLFDPDRFLERWAGAVGQLFTWVAACIWLALIVFALSSIAGRTDALVAGGGNVLSRDNLVLLYLAFIAVKVVHEFAHAFACKHLGLRNGSGGQVHTMGIMLLVLMPVPFVDASSAWAFSNKWHRILVAAAGMYVELGIAAVCAVVWVHTAEGTVAHAICFNVMFVASVSTLMFNGNPLLRYDGYFILSDALEMPNLAQRSKEYVSYLVKRFAWNVDQAASSAQTPSERKWLFSYAVGSTVYRVFVCFAILLFIADKFFVVGMILAVAAVCTWVVVPLGRILKYLMTSSELQCVRPRAIGSTVAVCSLVVTGSFLWPVADHRRAEGIVEPRQLAVIHAAVDGYVETAVRSGSRVNSIGPRLVTTSNRELEAERTGLLAESRGLRIQHRLALDEQDFAKAQTLAEQIASIERKARHLAAKVGSQTMLAPFPGVWVSPEAERLVGRYLHRGDVVGRVASLEDLTIRAVAKQEMAAQVYAEARKAVEIRAAGRSHVCLPGTIEQVLPVGHEHLPSAALGFGGGGAIQTDQSDPKGTKSREPFFEIRIRPGPDSQLLPGQRVVVRFRMRDKPLGVQLWQTFSRLIQKRFHLDDEPSTKPNMANALASLPN